MNTTPSPAPAPAPLEERRFVVIIKSLPSPMTRWTVDPQTFLAGLTRDIELQARMRTEGVLPLVTVTEEMGAQ